MIEKVPDDGIRPQFDPNKLSPEERERLFCFLDAEAEKKGITRSEYLARFTRTIEDQRIGEPNAETIDAETIYYQSPVIKVTSRRLVMRRRKLPADWRQLPLERVYFSYISPRSRIWPVIFAISLWGGILPSWLMMTADGAFSHAGMFPYIWIALLLFLEGLSLRSSLFPVVFLAVELKSGLSMNIVRSRNRRWARRLSDIINKAPADNGS